MINFKKKALLLFPKYVVIVSVVLSLSVIVGIALSSAACDVLALGKSERSVTITINEINELAGALEEYDIVEHPLLFSVYVKFCGISNPLTVRTKSVTVSADMSYKNLLDAFTSPPPTRTVTISFPNGATTDEIIDIFVKNGIGTREGFADAINNYPFEYDFVEVLDRSASPNRLYRLDGYLYPDTYAFYTGRTEAYYIYKMLDRFVAITSGIGMDVTDETVIIASMIQASSSNVTQFEYISSAIHNRLNDQKTYPYLSCPASSAYALGVGGIYVGVPTEEIKSVDSPYNTFINEGLPPGAICNPNKNALVAATYPAESNYKYYLTLENGSVILSRTEWEYNKNCEELSPHS